jgi:hypothetical protein
MDADSSKQIVVLLKGIMGQLFIVCSLLGAILGSLNPRK